MPLQSAAIPVNESAAFQHLEETAEGYIAPSYRIPESILEEITKYYQEQLAIKESEIRVLSNELSQIKKENQQQNYESEQIKSQYREEITKIPEVQQAIYKENGQEIQFITMLSNPKKVLSHEIYEIENKLEKQYPNWSLDFQYIGPRTFPEKLEEKYNLL